MKITRYGYDEVLLAFFACGIIATILWMQLSPAWAAIPASFFLFILWFFRDPERTHPDDNGILLSPADGTVHDIEELDEPAFMKQKSLRVGIFMSPFNVHLTRVPESGRISYINYEPGKFLSAFKPGAKTENENNSIGLITKILGKDTPILIKQISGVLARKIVCKCDLEQEVKRGQRVGMIKFGSRTEIYIPASLRPEIKVKIGDKVRGGETIIAEMK